MNGMQRDEAVFKVRLVRWLHAISLFLLVAVVALRPLVSETYDSAGNSITRAIEVLADPSPVRTLGFDLTILIATCLWLLAFTLDRAVMYRWTGLEIGLALLAIAGGVSCYFSGNKRLAINGTVDWLCLPILAITLVQLLRTQWQRRLVLAAILASASVNAAQCYEQYFVGYAETIEQYEAGKVEFWAKQGVDLDSTTVDAFERRLRAREASGHFAHSNVAGAYLMLCAFAAIGLIAPQLRKGRELSANPLSALALIVAVILAILLVGAVFLTGSTGTMVAGAIGLSLLVATWWKRKWIASRRRRVFWFSWIAVIAGIAAVVGHGLYHDSLPGWSLTFRWQYWKASAAMIVDHFWTGVGRENFGRHYTLYKDIASPEEVSNPHNFFIQFAAEWGIVGLIAVVAMLVGVTRIVARSRPNTSNLQPESTCDPASCLACWVGLGAVIILGRALLLGTDDPNYVYYSAATTGIIWLPAFFAFTRGAAIRCENPANVLTLALAAGLAAFLLQDMISFALFIPASATTFFALLAVWLSESSGRPASMAVSSRPLGRILAMAFAAGLTTAFTIYVFAPVFRSQYWRDAAQRQMRDDNVSNAVLDYRRSEAADPLDPTPCVEEARCFAAGDNAMVLGLALQLLSQAQSRDPFNASLFRLESQIHARVARLTGKSQEYLAAVQATKAALALYPQDPAGMVLLADTELEAGIELQSNELLLAAVGHYQEALALDEKRLEWETIQRFRPRVVDEIHAKIRSAESALAELE